MSLIALILFLFICTLYCTGLLFQDFCSEETIKKIAGVSKVRERRLVVNKLMKIIISNRQKWKIPVRSDPIQSPIRSGIRSDPESDPEYDPDFVDGQKNIFGGYVFH